MKKFTLAAILLLVAGCSSTPEPTPMPPVATPAPPPVSTPQPKPPEFKPMPADTCGAQPLQALVGKPRTEIPVPVDPSKRRVLCSTCAATMDYRADRQTIVFDTETGIIQSVKCG